VIRLWFLLPLLLLQDPEVKVLRDLTYYEGKDADRRKHKLNLILPESEKPVPVVMWIHGGGWTQGDRRIYTALGRRFAEQGIGLAAISYRLSPKVRHPEHIKDCARAFAWLHKNVKKHGGDPDRLFVSGQSAGGHLSALLTLDRSWLEELEVPADALKGAVPMSGVYEIPAVREDAVGPLAIFHRAFGGDEDVCRKASPVTHVKKLTVPMMVITETDDNFFLRPGMKKFRKAFEKAGIDDVRFVDAKDRNHISIVTHMMRKGEDPARDAIITFVKQRCKELDEGGK
jgi:dienelactone hydrolase